MCDVPTDGDICGLMIVSSPHLARSYHHLSPVKPAMPSRVSRKLISMWVPLSDTCCRTSVEEVRARANVCHACARPFPTVPCTAPPSGGISPLGRYRCPDCDHDFCTECSVLVHDVVHCCPGCGKQIAQGLTQRLISTRMWALRSR